jgi:hypothetical protein
LSPETEIMINYISYNSYETERKKEKGEREREREREGYERFSRVFIGSFIRLEIIFFYSQLAEFLNS